MKEQDYINYLFECTINVEVNEGYEFLLQITEQEGEEYVSTSIINAFLFKIGEKWKTDDDFSIADTYIASKIVKLYLEKVSEKQTMKDENKKAIMGNIKNDFQSTGRKLVIRFLEMDGWNVIDLGNDVDPDEFVKVAKAERVRFIGVSAMLYENAKFITDVVELLDEEYGDSEDKPFLIVGGAIFNVVPGLAEELSVEYTATNAYEAKEVFNSLYRRVKNV